MVMISRWQFVNDLQFKYSELSDSFDIQLQINLRDGSGEPLLTESFTLRLTDVSGEGSDCQEVSATNIGNVRDYMFAIESWKYDAEMDMSTTDSTMMNDTYSYDQDMMYDHMSEYMQHLHI
jgi:hypothetical protein